MAKQNMIQRDKKREGLVVKHLAKRELLKNELKSATSFQDRLALYKKFEKFWL
jgi:hypothetical protein